MSYVKGDRVRMVNNPAQVGTVSGERDQMFLSFVGIQWQSGDFAFVPPSNIELDTPAIVGQSKPSPDGKVLTDWQTRAERAEAESSRYRGLYDEAETARTDAEAAIDRVREQLGRMSGRATDLIRAALDAEQ